MPKIQRKVSKCPKCCPTGGAIFKMDFVGHDERTDGVQWEWVCCNCYHRTPYKPHKPTGKLTRSQQNVIDKLRNAGWTVEHEFVGNSSTLWVSAKRDLGNSALNLFSGDSLYGTVGQRGAFKLTLQKFGGDVVVTDFIGFSVYLTK